MLASLLPGLRDVRTPLTVGYLWLINLWVWFGDLLPQRPPTGDSLIARLYALGELAGLPAVLASVSFLAYLLGAVLVFPSQTDLVVRVANKARHWLGADRRHESEAFRTRQSYADLVRVRAEASRRLVASTYRHDGAKRATLEREIEGAARASPNDLRTRLLVTNQELYGEYDRLVAEADFRVNVAPPLLALGLTGAFSLESFGFASVATTAGSGALFCVLIAQGNKRNRRAFAVVYRAVLHHVIQHPIEVLSEQIWQEARGERKGRRRVTAHPVWQGVLKLGLRDR